MTQTATIPLILTLDSRLKWLIRGKWKGSIPVKELGQNQAKKQKHPNSNSKFRVIFLLCNLMIRVWKMFLYLPGVEATPLDNTTSIFEGDRVNLTCRSKNKDTMIITWRWLPFDPVLAESNSFIEIDANHLPAGFLHKNYSYYSCLNEITLLYISLYISFDRWEGLFASIWEWN